MSQTVSLVAQEFHISSSHASRLQYLSQLKHISQDEIVTKALDILFSLTDLLDGESERLGWTLLSQESLERLWDNDLDAAYDDWRKLYGVPEG